jgi:hypothetical protein
VREGTNIVFQSTTIMRDLYFAINERIWAGTKTGGITFSLDQYTERYSDENLAGLKLLLRQNIGNFLDHTRFPNPNDPTSIIITTTNSSFLQLIYWNETNILAHCQLPTNFFTFTPPRNLAGHPGTGSASWTNGASYGWDATKKVIRALIYTYENKGILQDEFRQTTLVGITGPDNAIAEFSLPSGECVNDTLGVGPIPISSLLFSNYVSGLSYSRTASRLKFYAPNEGGPYRFSGDTRDYSAYMEKADFTRGQNGIIAAYVGPTNSPIVTNNHVAISFYLESGTGPSNCFFVASTIPRPVIPWRVGDQISGIEFTADDRAFIVGTRYQSDVDCDLWNSETLKPYDDGIDTQAEFTPSGDCGATFPDESYIAETSANSGASLNSQRQYVHIIEWDFTYK